MAAAPHLPQRKDRRMPQLRPHLLVGAIPIACLERLVCVQRLISLLPFAKVLQALDILDLRGPEFGGVALAVW